MFENLLESLTLKNQVSLSSKEHALLNDIDSCRSAAQKFIAMSESFGVINNFERQNCQTGLCPLQLHVLFMLVGQHCFFSKAIYFIMIYDVCLICFT